MLIVARILHVVLGIFWVGSMLFNAFFLMPAMREAGPEGAKVGAAVMRKGFAAVMPIAAIVTILSGFWLYWRVVGFSAAAMHSARGLAYGVGGSLAIIAYVIGVAIGRRVMMRSVALGQAAAAATETERASLLAQAAALRARGASISTLVAVLLLLTAVAMSIGRYV